MDKETAEKIKAVIRLNDDLKAENESLKQELNTCINTIDNIFGKLINEKTNQLDFSKTIGLISNPGVLGKDIDGLMQILKKYKKDGQKG